MYTENDDRRAAGENMGLSHVEAVGVKSCSHFISNTTLTEQYRKGLPTPTSFYIVFLLQASTTDLHFLSDITD